MLSASERSILETKPTELGLDRSFTTTENNVVCFPESLDSSHNSHTDFDDFLDELCVEIPGFHHHLDQANKWVANTIYKPEVFNLARLRLEKGYSQRDLAKKMSTSQAQLSRIESGTQDPTLSTLENIATALEEDISRIIEAIIGGRK